MAAPPFADEAARLAPALPGASGPLGELRARGLAAWRRSGLPTRRLDAWKYTGLNALAEGGFVTDAGDRRIAALPDRIAGLDAHLMVFVNGRFRPDLSRVGALPDGVALTPLGAAPGPGRTARLDCPMVALNTALFADGLRLAVDAGRSVGRPVHLVSVGDAATPLAAHPRHLVTLGAGARATLVESHAGTGPAFINGVSEIALGPGAALDHVRLQDEAPEALHLAHSRVTLAGDAAYAAFTAQLGAALARHEMHVDLAGAGASARVGGVVAASGRQTHDNTAIIVHEAPHCLSRMEFRGALGGTSRGVFQGRTVVAPGAAGTDAGQLSRMLLLSPGAEADSRPELRIHADDVRCSHGATAGGPDAGALYYLRARGIPLPQARQMLVAGFLAGATAVVARDDVRAAADAALARRLAGLLGEG